MKKYWWVALAIGLLMIIVPLTLLLLPSNQQGEIPEKTEPAAPIITKTPDEMVLKVTDLKGDGWKRTESLPVPEHGAEYAYQVAFLRDSSTGSTDDGEMVSCKVALYYKEAEAHSAFLTFRSNYINDTGDEPPEPSSSLGDESFLDTRPVINGTSLVFRKANVIVWLSVNHEYKGDIESLARIVEGRTTESY